VISEETYARDSAALGRRGHLHDGVWWKTPYPGYSKPLFEFRAIVPGESRPASSRALLGYSHHVPEARMGNRFKEYLILEGEALRTFGLPALSSKKRNQVRKGLKLLQVRPVREVEPFLDSIRDIYVSQATRHTERYDLPDTPPTFYTEHEQLWRTRELRHLGTCGRELYGAFAEDRLVAFLVTSHVEGTRFIEKMKSHTDYLHACPSDALYFTVLEEAGRDPACLRVVNPGFRGEGLTHFKEQFLFRRTQVPMYVSNPRLFAWGERMVSLWARVRHRGRAPRETSEPSGEVG
jgi:hypothetical protein